MEKDWLGCLGLIMIYLIVFVLTNFLAWWLWGIVAVGYFALPALSFWQIFALRALLYFIAPVGISSVTRSNDN